MSKDQNDKPSGVDDSAATHCYAVIDRKVVRGAITATGKNGWKTIVADDGEEHKEQSGRWAETERRACELAVRQELMSRRRRRRSIIESGEEIQFLMNLRDSFEA